MKKIYILILFTCFACSQKPKEKKEPIVKAEDAANVEGTSDSAKAHTTVNFNNIIDAIKTKSPPFIDSTNFDNFDAKQYYDKEEIRALKLEKLYPSFHENTHNYKAKASYKLDFSKDFHTVVLIVLKGEHELESVLINYDLNGKIIDSKVISYDEIAEGMFKIESRIEEDKLTINSIADLEEISTTIEMFKIDDDGTIKPIASVNTNTQSNDISLIDNVIQQLNLNKSKIKEDLIVSKVQPHNSNETIVVIPEIAIEEDDMFELNSHIVLVNTTTKKITHNYFESYKTNDWLSDAVAIEEISIDTAPYLVSEDSRAFGIRMYRYNRSQPNPYSNKTISLFVKSENSLTKILKNYDVMVNGGEWDTNCDGEFRDIKNTLIMTNKKTNGYFDILVKSIVIEIKNKEDEIGECQTTKDSSTDIKTLKYNGSIYKN